ncbi:MAG: M14 family metallopeptidase [Longimicrobiales bacterium]|nr:M14 family metallopeptidase [Longimicrobiales bacterium]
MKRRSRSFALLGPLLLLVPLAVGAQEGAAIAEVTTPLEHFGFEIGADYQLANYAELQSYWVRLARESDRMVLDTIGTTTRGRPQLMAIVSAPDNLRQLDRYRRISERLTRARGLTEEEARRLSEEGRAVVWIDGGLHANEVLSAQQLIELVFRMASRTDPETLRILDDVILLAAHANPDGHDLLANWYMRRDDPLQRSTDHVPILYQEYAGHDNNRDFYMSNLRETTHLNRVLYREWYPQIVYNHHQRGPLGTIMFAPPFRDPANHYIDPLMLTSIQQVGSAMHQRFVEEGKGGTTMRSGATYSTWWNGGLRTTPYFHNMIGLLTETRGHPTPIEIPFVPERQSSTNSDLPLPVEPTGRWHFRQSVEYSQTANWAVLDYASRNRDRLLMNAWRMGRNSIERGSRDHWTVLPGDIERAGEVLGSTRTPGSRAEWESLLHRPEDRDPRAYVLPSDQADFNTATKLVNALLKTGVEVHRAAAAFEIDGTAYPEGSWVVRTDQAFRPHVLDMFEPQDHPDDFQYPGGPPVPPYDLTGWTLAYQMGVEFDRILDAFDAPLEPVGDLAELGPGRIIDTAGADPSGAPAGAVPSGGSGRSGGWLLDHRVNDAFTAVNRLLAAGVPVYWLLDPTATPAPGGGDGPQDSASDAGSRVGTFYVPRVEGAAETLAAAVEEAGVVATALAHAPTGAAALELEPLRIGLWDEYGGSIDSGWTRFVLEAFGFAPELVFPRELDAGDLHEDFDVLVFPDGAIPRNRSSRSASGQPGPSEIPSRWRERLGHVSDDVTVPRILEFLEEGGTVITLGSSTSLGYHAGLPIFDWLTDERGRSLSRDEYYIPGSVLEVRLAGDLPATHGLPARADVLFDEAPVFGLEPGAIAQGVRALAWFDTSEPLRSGWAWQQERLLDGTTMLQAPVGEGRLYLFGPDILFRGQSHGTFGLLFNAMHSGAGQATTVPGS